MTSQIIRLMGKENRSNNIIDHYPKNAFRTRVQKGKGR